MSMVYWLLVDSEWTIAPHQWTTQWNTSMIHSGMACLVFTDLRLCWQWHVVRTHPGFVSYVWRAQVPSPVKERDRRTGWSQLSQNLAHRQGTVGLTITLNKVFTNQTDGRNVSMVHD